MKLKINDTITWSSAAGQMVGSIIDINIALNAAKQHVAWMVVKTDRTNIQLCGTESNLKMLKVVKI